MPSEELLEKVSHLPTTPGVYLWRDQYNRSSMLVRPLTCAIVCVPMYAMMPIGHLRLRP